jgi:hypothetical protein
LLVGIEVVVGEAAVGEVLVLVLFLDAAVLCDDVLISWNAYPVLAFKDVGLASGET